MKGVIFDYIHKKMELDLELKQIDLSKELDLLDNKKMVNSIMLVKKVKNKIAKN